MVEYQLIPAIDPQLTLHWHLDQHLTVTYWSILGWHSVNTCSMSWSTSWKSLERQLRYVLMNTQCISANNLSWLLTERSIKCTQLKCWSRVLIDTQLQMPLVHEKNYSCFTFKIGNMEREKRESIDTDLLCVNLESKLKFSKHIIF